MRGTKTILIIETLLFTLLILPSVTFSQTDELKISRLKISLWPEYDKPSVLVLYDGSVASSVNLPTFIELPVIPGADVHAASVLPSGGHIHDPLNYMERDGITYVSFMLKERDFHAEFYYNPFPSGIPRRSFSYRFVAPYDITMFDYEVQQPLGASNFFTVPTSLQGVSDASGIPVHQVSAGNLLKGEARELTVSYDKGDDILSKARLEGTNEGGGFYDKLIIAVVAAFVLLMIYSALKRSSADKRKVVRAGAKRKAAAGVKVQGGSAVGKAKRQREDRRTSRPNYCSNCGEKLDPDARFCSSCGKNV